MMNSYATIDGVVRGALADISESSEHKYQQFLHWALECVQDFASDSSQEVKTISLTMNDLKQVELPLDFVDWVKVGIRCGDKIKIFQVSDKISMAHPVDSCNEPIPFDAACDVNTLPLNYNQIGGYYFMNGISDYGENLGGLFGYGGGYSNRGYFTVYKNQSPGVIQFTSEVNNTVIYLEYISTGFDPTETTVVNQYAKKMIKEYIHWRRLWFAGDGKAAKAEELYYRELNLVRHRLMDLSISDILELSRKHQGQAIKQ